ncbi:Uncharacterised protein [Klebsiella variicola]|uniref:Uncharacterized protein n=1 Tax=Klebsiella variicola TaxID=244366 RepID=A0A7H4MRM4_KLEVA|nr:Uncharacterised protein [Klebsiella variicola]
MGGVDGAADVAENALLFLRNGAGASFSLRMVRIRVSSSAVFIDVFSR